MVNADEFAHGWIEKYEAQSSSVNGNGICQRKCHDRRIKKVPHSKPLYQIQATSTGWTHMRWSSHVNSDRNLFALAPKARRIRARPSKTMLQENLLAPAIDEDMEMDEQDKGTQRAQERLIEQLKESNDKQEPPHWLMGRSVSDVLRISHLAGVTELEITRFLPHLTLTHIRRRWRRLRRRSSIKAHVWTRWEDQALSESVLLMLSAFGYVHWDEVAHNLWKGGDEILRLRWEVVRSRTLGLPNAPTRLPHDSNLPSWTDNELKLWIRLRRQGLDILRISKQLPEHRVQALHTLHTNHAEVCGLTNKQLQITKPSSRRPRSQSTGEDTGQSCKPTSAGDPGQGSAPSTVQDSHGSYDICLDRPWISAARLQQPGLLRSYRFQLPWFPYRMPVQKARYIILGAPTLEELLPGSSHSVVSGDLDDERDSDYDSCNEDQQDDHTKNLDSVISHGVDDDGDSGYASCTGSQRDWKAFSELPQNDGNRSCLSVSTDDAPLEAIFPPDFILSSVTLGSRDPSNFSQEPDGPRKSINGAVSEHPGNQSPEPPEQDVNNVRDGDGLFSTRTFSSLVESVLSRVPSSDHMTSLFSKFWK